MLQTLRAILFDLDDTLYPEREYVLSGFRAVADWAEHHLSLPSRQVYAQLTNLFDEGVRGKTFDRWRSDYGLSNSVQIETLVRVYREHIPQIHLFPDAIVTLSAARNMYRLGLVSDGYHEVQQRKIASLGIERYFDAIVLSDSLGREFWKPSSKPFDVALGKLAINAEHAVYVGDNPGKDFLGARRAGLHSVRIKRPSCEHTNDTAPTPEHMPDLTIESLDELMMALKNTEKSQNPQD